MPAYAILKRMRKKAGIVKTSIAKRICVATRYHDQAVKDKPYYTSGNLKDVINFPNLGRPLLKWICKSHCPPVKHEQAPDEPSTSPDQRIIIITLEAKSTSNGNSVAPRISVREAGFEADTPAALTAQLSSVSTTAADRYVPRATPSDAAVFAAAPAGVSLPVQTSVFTEFGYSSTNVASARASTHHKLRDLHASQYHWLPALLSSLLLLLLLPVWQRAKHREEKAKLQAKLQGLVNDAAAVKYIQLKDRDEMVQAQVKVVAAKDDRAIKDAEIIKNLFDENTCLEAQRCYTEKLLASEKSQSKDASDQVIELENAAKSQSKAAHDQVTELKEAAKKKAESHKNEKDGITKKKDAAEKKSGELAKELSEEKVRTEELSKEVDVVKKKSDDQEKAHAEQLSGWNSHRDRLVSEICDMKLAGIKKSVEHDQEVNDLMSSSARKLQAAGELFAGLEEAYKQKDQSFVDLSQKSKLEREKLEESIVTLQRAAETQAQDLKAEAATERQAAEQHITLLQDTCNTKETEVSALQKTNNTLQRALEEKDAEHEQQLQESNAKLTANHALDLKQLKQQLSAAHDQELEHVKARTVENHQETVASLQHDLLHAADDIKVLRTRLGEQQGLLAASRDEVGCLKNEAQCQDYYSARMSVKIDELEAALKTAAEAAAEKDLLDENAKLLMENHDLCQDIDQLRRQADQHTCSATHAVSKPDGHPASGSDQLQTDGTDMSEGDSMPRSESPEAPSQQGSDTNPPGPEGDGAVPETGSAPVEHKKRQRRRGGAKRPSKIKWQEGRAAM